MKSGEGAGWLREKSTGRLKRDLRESLETALKEEKEEEEEEEEEKEEEEGVGRGLKASAAKRMYSLLPENNKQRTSNCSGSWAP